MVFGWKPLMPTSPLPTTLTRLSQVIWVFRKVWWAPPHWWRPVFCLREGYFKKSRIRETLNLSACADNSTDTKEPSKKCQVSSHIYPELHCTALHCTELHCAAQHCTAMHCTYCTDIKVNWTKKSYTGAKYNELVLPKQFFAHSVCKYTN